MYCYHYTVVVFILLPYQNYKYFENGNRMLPVLNTTLGAIRGVFSEDRDYIMYLGVPYALVDEKNPFGKSLPHPKFEGIFDANNESQICPQIEEFTHKFEGTIDCLRLNIYTPKFASSSNPLPTLVWFPGGQFKFGTAGRYVYGPKFLVKQGIVVIAVNSRVGPYGYLCLDTPEVSGNQGLKDQVTALRWIRRHVEEFGGDPNKVTIAGSSSSAFGVDLIFRANTENLFSNVIIQSGTVEYFNVIEKPSHDVVFNLAGKSGLDTNNLTEALAFLVKVEPKLVIDASDPLDFMPCIENQFDNIENLITTHPLDPDIRKAKSTSIMIGNTDNEMICSKDTVKLTSLESAREYIKERLNTHFDFNSDEESELVEIIRQFYMEEDVITNKTIDQLIDFSSDFMFHHPTQRLLQKLLDNGAGNVYRYVFSYVGGRNFLKNRFKLTGDGATHADELGYLFDISYEEAPAPKDQLIIDRLTALWANFVKYGDPTPVLTEHLPVKWQPFTQKNSYYLNISTEVSLGRRVFQERMSFWDLFYKKYKKFLKRI